MIGKTQHHEVVSIPDRRIRIGVAKRNVPAPSNRRAARSVACIAARCSGVLPRAVSSVRVWVKVRPPLLAPLPTPPRCRIHSREHLQAALQSSLFSEFRRVRQRSADAATPWCCPLENRSGSSRRDVDRPLKVIFRGLIHLRVIAVLSCPLSQFARWPSEGGLICIRVGWRKGRRRMRWNGGLPLNLTVIDDPLCQRTDVVPGRGR